MFRRMPSVFAALLLSLSLVGAAETATPIPGQRVFVCGHSFHWYVADLLPAIERSAGITGATMVGVQKLGGSRVMQHWELPDDRNRAKQVLRAGKADVLTLSPTFQMPDEGIDLFADLAFAANPQVRVVVQMSWPGWDWHDQGSFHNADRDKASVEDLEAMATGKGREYRDRLVQQVEAINRRHGRTTVSIVPVGAAVRDLRLQVARGQIPGLTRQSQLFKDDIGHPGEAVSTLVAYCNFAVIYRRTPVGLTCFENGDAARTALNRRLQELAWEVVTREPLSGVAAGDR